MIKVGIIWSPEDIYVVHRSDVKNNMCCLSLVYLQESTMSFDDYVTTDKCQPKTNFICSSSRPS